MTARRFALRLAGQFSAAARLAYLWDIHRDHDPLMHAVERLVQPGDICVDIGASRGLYTARMSRLVGRGGRVHAFEPNPLSLVALRDGCSRLANVRIYPIALSDAHGEAVLRVPRTDGRPVPGMGTLRRLAAETQYDEFFVQVETLDATLESSRRVAFVKCDVEGHEDAVIDGAASTLQHDQPIVAIEIEQRHRLTAVEEAFEKFEALGYHGYAICADSIRPLNEFDLERDQLAHLGDDRAFRETMPRAYVHNFLFVHPAQAIATAASLKSLESLVV